MEWRENTHLDPEHPALKHAGESSYDDQLNEYRTLHGWAQLYCISYNSFRRALEAKDLRTYPGKDASNRDARLYQDRDIEQIAVTLFHQSHLPVLGEEQTCIIEWKVYITRQGFC